MTAQSRPPLSYRTRLGLAVALILLGIVAVVFFGGRTMHSFGQIQYIRSQGLEDGTASLDAIRPWMTVQFVAVAYAVPEEYLYSQVNIPFDQRNPRKPLGAINKDLKLGQASNGTDPAILDTVKGAITRYRANPVVTGLDDVRPWMSVRYISNSTGVPLDYLLQQANIPADGYADKPLFIVKDALHNPGGEEALVEALRTALSTYKATP